MLAFDVFHFISKNVLRSIRTNLHSFIGRLILASVFGSFGLFSFYIGIPIFKSTTAETLKGTAYVRLQDDASDVVMSQFKLQIERNGRFRGQIVTADEFYDRTEMPQISDEEKNQWQPKIIEVKVFGTNEVSKELNELNQNPLVKSVDFIESPAQERNQVTRTISILFLILSSVLMIEGGRILIGLIRMVRKPLNHEIEFFSSFGASPFWSTMTIGMSWVMVLCPLVLLQGLFYFGATKVPQVKSVGSSIVNTVERLSLSK